MGKSIWTGPPPNGPWPVPAPRAAVPGAVLLLDLESATVLEEDQNLTLVYIFDRALQTNAFPLNTSRRTRSRRT